MARSRIILSLVLFVFSGNVAAAKDGLVSMVVSSPIFANGTVRDMRSGINIYLQSSKARGLDFMDPAVMGHGIPPGGRMEVEMVKGFQRDPKIPLAQPSILLVAGTPQQGLSGKAVGYTVSEGRNPNTFVITPKTRKGLKASKLLTGAPGAKLDPIPQRGIKIIHVGMKMAFVSRGEQGLVAVRIYDGRGKIVRSGAARMNFLERPIPQIFPTNIPHQRRNHNWQRVAARQSVGGTDGTVPLSFLLFDRNKGFGNKGLLGVGVLSIQELARRGMKVPGSLRRFGDGLILQDADGDGRLDPAVDRIIGGVTIDAPRGARGYQARTPRVRGAPYLSAPTSAFDERAGAKLGGSIMLLEFVAGDKKGVYRSTFTLLADPNDAASPDGSSYSYSVVVK